MSTVSSIGDTAPDANGAGPPADTQRCTACQRLLPVTDFLFKKKRPCAHVTRTKTCENRAVRKQTWCKDKAREADGKKPPLGANKQKARSDALEELPLSAFLRFLEEKGMVCDIEALVSISEIGEDRRE